MKRIEIASLLSAVTLLPSAATAAQTGTSSLPAAPKSTVPITRVVVADGLKHPWSIAFLPNEEFLVTEKDGGIKRIDAKGNIRAIQGLPEDLDNVRQNPRDNSGLFEIVLHPAFPSNDSVYLTYSSKGPGGTALKLVKARLRDDRLSDIQTMFLAGPRSADRFHYGGGLVLGADQKLYLTAGERHYSEGDNPPLPVAQDPADSRGKIYRLNLDGSIPADNPEIGDNAVPGIFAMGIRAAQGMTVEPATGRIWFTEHGSIGGDEINMLVLGANFGWPNRTSGSYRDGNYRPPALSDRPFTDPVYSWRDRTVAPTGLTFYSGKTFPEWRGDLIVAGLSRGYLMRLDVEKGAVIGIEYLLEDESVRLRKVAQSPSGELFVLTDEANGKLIRLDRGAKSSESLQVAR